MDKWEYYTLIWGIKSGIIANEEDLEDELDELGSDGWELVNSVSMNDDMIGGISEGTISIAFMFKRKMQ
jgi:hypothetical protein